MLETKCVDFLPNLIWVKFLKITAWKATEGQDLQNSSKKSTKIRKIEKNDLYKFEGKFREISQNPRKLESFDRNLRISKFYKQNFKQFWTIWRSQIGICEKCLKILRKFIIFGCLSEIFVQVRFAKILRFWQAFLGFHRKSALHYVFSVSNSEI